MTDQELKELQYLRHVLLNGTTKVMGCLTEIEKIVKAMSDAVKAYHQEDMDDTCGGADKA